MLGLSAMASAFHLLVTGLVWELASPKTIWGGEEGKARP